MKNKEAEKYDILDYENINVAGIEGSKKRAKILFGQFEDIIFDVIDYFQESDKIVVFYDLSMTHIGKWREIPPTGIRVKIHGYNKFQFKDGKIYTITSMLSIFDLLKQLNKSTIDVNNEHQLNEYLDNIKAILASS